MPTVFALVMFAILLGGAVAGLVVWARQQSQKKVRRSRRLGTSDAPYEENTAAAQHMRQSDSRGWF